MSYPKRVPRDEQPEYTIENIPDDVLKSAISIAVKYGACPHCGESQFYNTVPGHNSSHECQECNETMTVVG